MAPKSIFTSVHLRPSAKRDQGRLSEPKYYMSACSLYIDLNVLLRSALKIVAGFWNVIYIQMWCLENVTRAYIRVPFLI
jgi:hypothetical protein